MELTYDELSKLHKVIQQYISSKNTENFTRRQPCRELVNLVTAETGLLPEQWLDEEARRFYVRRPAIRVGFSEEFVGGELWQKRLTDDEKMVFTFFCSVCNWETEVAMIDVGQVAEYLVMSKQSMYDAINQLLAYKLIKNKKSQRPLLFLKLNTYVLSVEWLVQREVAIRKNKGGA